MRALAAIVLLAACGSSPPASHDPPPPPRDPPPPDAGPAPTLYQDGEVYHPQSADDDRFTCVGTDDMVAACTALRPDARCVLDSPPGYWWEIRCKGTAPTDAEEQQQQQRLRSLYVPQCECSCDPHYYEAADRLDAERERCSRVP